MNPPVLSETTYDSIRTKTLKGVSNIEFEGLGTGVVISQDNNISVVPLGDRSLLVGTTGAPVSLKILDTDSIIVTTDATTIRFSLNPARQDTLEPIDNNVDLSSAAYNRFVVEGPGSSMATLSMDPDTSYRITADSITYSNNTFIRIKACWLVKYSGSIEVNLLTENIARMGSETVSGLLLTPGVNSVTLSNALNTTWTTKFSILRLSNLFSP